jgi:hypothetical protein
MGAPSALRNVRSVARGILRSKNHSSGRAHEGVLESAEPSIALKLSVQAVQLERSNIHFIPKEYFKDLPKKDKMDKEK